MKRFYKDVAVGHSAGGFHILLDGKQVRTPARHVLTVPTTALAEAIAAEWRAQEDEVTPAAMPLLRLANTAQDGVATSRAEVIAAILRFGEHDLLCYRGEGELARRQQESWRPMLDWAAQELDAALTVTEGVGHVDQPPDTLAALERAIAALDDYALTGLHVTASITGSLVLGLALARGAINPAQAFQLSRQDELFQAETWGQDSEAEFRAQALAREIAIAARLIDLAGA